MLHNQNLDSIALKYGTDKRVGHHGYTVQYEAYFDKTRNDFIKILEIGVKEGRSLKMWEEYFPNAKVYGIDIGNCKKYETDRIKTFEGNQTDEKFLKDVMNEIGEVDIIIDDGSHRNSHQQISLYCLFSFLKEGGMYIIEDLHSSYGAKHSYGGGFKKEGTTIELLKNMLDTIHYPVHFQCMDYFTNKISGIHIYQDICFIMKKKRDWCNRDVLIKLIKENNYKKIAEIGAGKGKLTRTLLFSLCKDIITEYWAMDTWKEKDDNMYLHFCKNMRWAKQLRVMRLDAIKVKNLFHREYFDLVYIECKFIPNIADTINVWLPMIRKGGVLVGNNYDSVKEMIGKVELWEDTKIWVKHV